jgi:catechol-2,3-dioxygenase
MIPVQRLNHAVLYVRDARVAAAFYQEAFGFEVVASMGDGQAVFLKAAGSSNHHDLGLFSIGADAPGPTPGRVGLYHLAWQVASVTDLAAARDTLGRMGALVGESDHGATKSLYGKDPDGNEFEVMWMVPRELWGDDEHAATVAPLHLDREIARFGS